LFSSLHIIGSRQFGGAEQFYVRLVGMLAERGQRPIAASRPGSPVARALADVPVEQINLPLANQWDYWSMWRIRALIAERRPSIVQTYMGRATRLTRLAPAGSSVHIARLGGYYKIDGYYRHAHVWVGNTRGICDYLVRSGLPARRVFHIGNFVPAPRHLSDERKDQLRRLHQIPQAAVIVFALGRLIPKKGFQDLLEAFARLPAEVSGRPLILLIAGDGPLQGELEGSAIASGIAPRVRWLGWQDPPDPFYDLADVLVCPSRHEPLGNVILEAWNYRLPVVSTASDGALELIEDGHSGLLCPCADPKALAARLEAVLMASDQARRDLGNAGHAALERHHGRDAVVEAYLALYARLSAERANGPG
jgi:glycosyltransferase involved in cell wall biosynthesis